jgi:hypothetical protein
VKSVKFLVVICVLILIPLLLFAEGNRQIGNIAVARRKQSVRL